MPGNFQFCSIQLTPPRGAPIASDTGDNTKRSLYHWRGPSRRCQGSRRCDAFVSGARHARIITNANGTIQRKRSMILSTYRRIRCVPPSCRRGKHQAVVTTHWDLHVSYLGGEGGWLNAKRHRVTADYVCGGWRVSQTFHQCRRAA